MNIEIEELDRWARMASRLAAAALDRNDSESAMEAGLLLGALERAGASVAGGDRQPCGSVAGSTGRVLGDRVCGPAAREYVEALTTAAEKARAMEMERHGKRVDGIGEVLEDLAAQARFEICGPVGLRGLE